ncbi:nickel-dependent hydrogenase large subunit [Accumulibacter sp.]|nr:nickel-dependent hydrogenase large subunit [Accumulibacter sp.]MCM8595218.1 nickel-dependent hydrogenase large subunit [Accumulibacter sp.]MDS4049364.1 nickel-dependent hydrogenase large subunit [Accumulibacter sp.]
MEPGFLDLTLTWDGTQIVAATVVSTRPVAARALCGLPVARVLELVPRLFAVCRQAQEAAARLALRAALGSPMDSVELAEHARRVAPEVALEHLWRLLLDWPPLFGERSRNGEFLDWRKRISAIADAGSAASVGQALVAWVDAQPQPVFAEDPAAAPVALLPQLSAAQWAGRVAGDFCVERPTFAGRPAETGALARRFADPGVAAWLASGQRVHARLAARLVDLRSLATDLAEPSRLPAQLDAATLAPGCGLARVETARGTLLHLVELDGQRVVRYLLVAPTEWNFHPRGAFVRELEHRPAVSRDQAMLVARRLALALDPCVPCEVRVNDA